MLAAHVEEVGRKGEEGWEVGAKVEQVGVVFLSAVNGELVFHFQFVSLEFLAWIFLYDWL